MVTEKVPQENLRAPGQGRDLSLGGNILESEIRSREFSQEIRREGHLKRVWLRGRALPSSMSLAQHCEKKKRMGQTSSARGWWGALASAGRRMLAQGAAEGITPVEQKSPPQVPSLEKAKERGEQCAHSHTRVLQGTGTGSPGTAG